MENIVKLVTNKWFLIGLPSTTVAALGIYRLLKKQTSAEDVTKELLKTYNEKDVIYLFTFARAALKYQLPSASPFPIKLETWFRLHKLEYKVHNREQS